MGQFGSILSYPIPVVKFSLGYIVNYYEPTHEILVIWALCLKCSKSATMCRVDCSILDVEAVWSSRCIFFYANFITKFAKIKNKKLLPKINV